MITSFEDYIMEVRPRLDDAIDTQLARLLGSADGQWTSLIQLSLGGGKRIRGCLLCLICDALGGDLESAIPRAVAIELIHMASLIHDDFVDQDTSRRSRPATWTLEGARRAVLLGDVVFASAIEMMSALSRNDGLVVSRAIANIARGAFHEETDPLKLASKIRQGSFDGSIYERIISLKTGILFGAACELGAVAAGAGSEAMEHLSRYGLGIGEAYQIADDLQDLKRYVATGFIGSNELALLAPALSSFAKDMQLQFVSMLEQPLVEIGDLAMQHFKTAEKLMEREIERRLDSIGSEFPADFLRNGYGDILRSAPRDLIRMFNNC